MNVVSWTTFIVITLINNCHVGSCFQNFALNKFAKQSSTLSYYFPWTADKAVDGNTNDGGNPDESKTCSATAGPYGTQTWEVDFGFLIIVKTITVYERTDKKDQLSGFKVFVGNTTMPWTVNQPLVEVKPVSTQHLFRVNDSLAQFVAVRRPYSNIMTICEVIVEGVCQKGNFGDVCNETCGNCLYGNDSCNSSTGQCTMKCQKGWRGGKCKRGCKKGTYGYNCNDTCGMCLNGNNSCSTIDGSCILGCSAGYQGENCKLECSNGTYGEGCNETCGMCLRGNDSCLTSNGYCQFGCEAGWWGDTCKQECHQGTYSYGCNETCGMCFSGNKSCSSIDGLCNDGCDAGWQGGTCKQECLKGSFGYGCIRTCGMCLSGNNSCSTIDGRCELGCNAGWRGESCIHECEKGTYGYGCNETCGQCMHGADSCSIINGTCIYGCQDGWKDEKCTLEIHKRPNFLENGIIIISAVVPIAIVIILLIIVLVVLRARRTRSKLTKDVPSMPNQEQDVFHQVIQEGEICDKKTQEIEDTILHKGSAYQRTEIKTQLIAPKIPVLSLWAHVTKLKANKQEFESAFQELSQGLIKNHEEALANVSKNRYKKIYPYDFNRVVLKRDSVHDSEYENDSDYINASHIQGFEGRKCYIAAQGPITKTVGDFWWMVWQERIKCIVMLTNLSEMGKMKCIQYWPDKGEQTYGDVTVQILGSESFTDSIRRDLQITVTNVSSAMPVLFFRVASQGISKFQYTAWPDKDVPDTAWSLVKFWKSVRKHNEYGKGPMAVHCSAGVGRTGTFIALDIIYDEACETGHVAVMKCVETLREQRVNMVQTVKQFIFLHDAVAETLGFGTMPIFKKQLPDVLRHLMEEDERSGLTRLQGQYNMLRKLNLEQEETNLPVYSNADGVQSEMIWLPNISGRDAYIAVKQVDNETLLTTIANRNIKWLIIVDSSTPEDVLVSIGVNQTKTVAGLDITCKEKEDLGAFERSQFYITSHGKKEQQQLIMVLLKTWEEPNEVPSDSRSVLSLLEDFSQHHPSPSELNPVLIYSRWELNRCSLIYILLNEKDRIRRDGEIHVLRTTAEMLGRSRTLLPTFEQYNFIYKYLPTDDLQESTYENTAGIMKEII
ncbi:hypothetical protein ACJMK2_032763 [Sinanodonta woodiana]|uniref:protein-tyrosine-phosphatase n=1 Tax=Sinanodonta woodiana TaxID=1069815 RepID=A0ABD3X2S7_SINWO